MEATTLLEAARDRSAALLIIGGGYDWNVPPVEVSSWEQHLQGSAGGFGTAVVGCVTHAMNCVLEPDWREITAGDIGRGVDPAVIELIAGIRSPDAD